MNISIPLSAPDISEDDIRAVAETLRSNRLSLGPKLQEFERAIADFANVKHAVAVNSGTSALHLAARALDLKTGDEVITTPFSFIASANAILYENAKPVFVDIDPNTLNLDADEIEAAITSKTKAMIIVHVFGRPAPMPQIRRIAEKYDLKIIEDAAEAIGARIGNQKIGSFGDAGVFAFYPNKQITTGEGGMLMTNDDQLAARVRQMRNQGRDQSADWFEHIELGYNYRLSDINCALGVEQLKRIDQILELRETVARKYDSRLRANPNLILPRIELHDARTSWFVYVVRLNENFGRAQRDFIVSEMQNRGIGCGRYFAPIHLQPFYKEKFGFKKGDFPVAEKAAEQAIALPFFNRISDWQIEQVCQNFEQLIAAARRFIL